MASGAHVARACRKADTGVGSVSLVPAFVCLGALGSTSVLRLGHFKQQDLQQKGQKCRQRAVK